jgi:hypothetical protein
MDQLGLFIDLFVERYSDLATIHNGGEQYTDSEESMTMCLYKLLWRKDVTTVSYSLSDDKRYIDAEFSILKAFLSKNVIIKGKYDTHSFVLIPFAAKKVMIIQNLEGVYGAFAAEYDINNMISLLYDLHKGFMNDLFMFSIRRPVINDIGVKYDIAWRSNADLTKIHALLKSEKGQQIAKLRKGFYGELINGLVKVPDDIYIEYEPTIIDALERMMKHDN